MSNQPYPFPPVGCLDRLVEEQAACDPDALALRWAGGGITRAELWSRCMEVVRRLQAMGLVRGDRVGLCVKHSPALVAGTLGILRAGGVCVPLEPDYPDMRLRTLIADVDARFILTGTGLADRAAKWGLPVISLNPWGDCPQQSTADTMLADPVHTENDLAFVFYTSGSTGTPKGVAQTHQQVCHGQLGAMGFFGLGQNDRVLLRAPISSSGMVCETFWPLLGNGCIVVSLEEGRADPRYLVSLLREEEVTVLLLVPSLLRALLEEKAMADCVSLRHVCSAGEILAHDLEIRFHSVLSGRLSVIYGTTEAPSTTIRLCTPGAADGITNVGWPVCTKRVYVVDGEGKLLPPGLSGEIYVGGPGIAQGYWLSPEKTAHCFLPDPFSEMPGARLYRTGDLGRFLLDGSLALLGRADEQIQVRGYRVEPDEIEAVLRLHLGVQDAFVRLNESKTTLMAWVAASRGAGVTAESLRNFLASRLPSHMIPASFVILDRIPRTLAGKVDRSSLPQPAPIIIPEPVEGGVFEGQPLDIWRDVLMADKFPQRGLRVASIPRRSTGKVNRSDLFGHFQDQLTTHATTTLPLPGDRDHDSEAVRTEQLLKGHPEILDCAVIPMPTRHGGANLIAFIVNRGLFTWHSFLDHLLQSGTGCIAPANFVGLKALPMNPDQLVDRQALAEFALKLDTNPLPREIPEIMLAAICRSVLGVERIKMQDDFFTLGVDSLKIMDLLVTIEREFGRAVSPETLFRQPTLEGLLQALQKDSSQAAESALIEIQRGSSTAPFFFIHGDYNGGGFHCRRLARLLGSDSGLVTFIPHGQPGQQIPTTIEAMADQYLPLLMDYQPVGPYRLGGHCNGALVALELGHRLAAAGQPIDRLVLISPPPIDTVPVRADSLSTVSESMLECTLRYQPTAVRRGILNVLYRRAIHRYIPRQFDGKTSLLMTAVDSGNAPDPSRGWLSLLPQAKIHRIPGEHLNIFTKHLPILASALQHCLDES